MSSGPSDQVESLSGTLAQVRSALEGEPEADLRKARRWRIPGAVALAGLALTFVAVAIFVIGLVLDRRWPFLDLVVGLSFVGIFLALALTFLAAVVAAVLYLIGAVASLSRYPRPRQLAREVLGSLAPEIDPKAPVELYLDRRRVDRDAHQVPPGQTLQRNWLGLRFTLLDKSRVELLAITHLKQKRRSKRRYTKVKERLFESLIVRLSPPRGTALRPLPASVGQLGGLLTLHRMRTKPRGADLEWRTPAGLQENTRRGWGGELTASLLSTRGVLLGFLGSYKLVARGQRTPAPRAPAPSAGPRWGGG